MLSVEARIPDTNSDSLQALGGEAVILGVGTVLLGFQFAYIRTSNQVLGHLLYELLFPTHVTLGLLVGGAWLYFSGLEEKYFLRVGFWCLAGMNVMLAGSALTLISLHGHIGTMYHPILIMFDYISGGAAAGFVLGVYDSNRREKAAELETANEQMTWLNQQLSVLNRVLRHDIRNDANVIMGYADRIEDQHPDAAEHTQVIQNRATDLVELGNKARNVEHLLNRDSWECESIDVVPIVEREVSRIDEDHPALEIETDLPDAAPVRALPLLTTAVEEVLENAVKHNDASDPRVAVAVETCTRDGTEWVQIRVADNGPGLPEQEISVLDQERETDLRHASGLGLWLVNWATEASGGEVIFERNDPTGSVVILRLESVA